MNDLAKVFPKDSTLRPTGVPRINVKELILITVGGKIAHPTRGKSVYRIGQDGTPRVLPGTGGIVLNHRVGDRCVGLAADHVEPGVSVRNDDSPVKGAKDGHNLALNTYACVGNTAVMLDGPCRGNRGVVIGKHGGVNHVLVDFPAKVLAKLQIGDRMQIYGHGLGMRFLDHPGVHVYNCSPRLIRHWGLTGAGRRLRVPVTHLIPAALMGSGLGRGSTVMGDYDIQLFDQQVRRQYGLGSLRIGDMVALAHADNRFGRAYHQGYLSVGIVVHGDSSVSGHGPGVVTLLTGPARCLEPVRERQANLAVILRLRRPQTPRPQATLIEKQRPPGSRRRSSASTERGDTHGRPKCN
jgi:hypothetical protein